MGMDEKIGTRGLTTEEVISTIDACCKKVDQELQDTVIRGNLSNGTAGDLMKFLDILRLLGDTIKTLVQIKTTGVVSRRVQEILVTILSEAFGFIVTSPGKLTLMEAAVVAIDASIQQQKGGVTYGESDTSCMH